MIRFCLITVLLACCGVVAAQNTLNLSGTVMADYRDYFLIEIDHGSTSTALDVDVDISTTTTDGLFVRLTDLQLASILATSYMGLGSVSTGMTGTVSFTLSLPARVGKHNLFLEINDFTTGTAGTTDYSGTVTSTAGTLTEIDSKEEEEIYIGARSHWDLVLDYHLDFTDLSDGELNWKYTSSATLNSYGSVGLLAYGVDTYSYKDTTTTPGAILQSGSGQARTGYVLNETILTNGSWTGERRLQLLYSKNGPGLIDFRVFPDEASFVFWILARNKNGGSEGGTCSTDDSNAPLASLLLFAISSMLVVRQLRRRKCVGAHA